MLSTKTSSFRSRAATVICRDIYPGAAAGRVESCNAQNNAGYETHLSYRAWSPRGQPDLFSRLTQPTSTSLSSLKLNIKPLNLTIASLQSWLKDSNHRAKSKQAPSGTHMRMTSVKGARLSDEPSAISQAKAWKNKKARRHLALWIIQLALFNDLPVISI